MATRMTGRMSWQGLVDLVNGIYPVCRWRFSPRATEDGLYFFSGRETWYADMLLLPNSEARGLVVADGGVVHQLSNQNTDDQGAWSVYSSDSSAGFMFRSSTGDELEANKDETGDWWLTVTYSAENHAVDHAELCSAKNYLLLFAEAVTNPDDLRINELDVAAAGQLRVLNAWANAATRDKVAAIADKMEERA